MGNKAHNLPYSSSLQSVVVYNFSEIKSTVYGSVACLKKGAWIACKFKKGLGKKEGADVFEMGFTPQCTLWVGGAILLTQIFKAHNILTQ